MTRIEKDWDVWPTTNLNILGLLLQKLIYEEKIRKQSNAMLLVLAFCI